MSMQMDRIIFLRPNNILKKRLFKGLIGNLLIQLKALFYIKNNNKEKNEKNWFKLVFGFEFGFFKSP